jgi:predicted nucleic acid-binding protein
VTYCVVDASIGIKLFLVERLSEQADALFGHLTDALPASLYVPDLFYIECANILWEYVRGFGYPPEAARQDVTDLARLPVRPVSTAALVEPALSLPLVTADGALARKLAGTGADVRFIGDRPGSAPPVVHAPPQART